MAFARELTQLRQELRLGVAGTIYSWPKQVGANVDVSTATFEVYDPSGALIQSGTATQTAAGGGDKLSCSVSAINTLGEGYTCRVTSAATGFDGFDPVPFDVVKHPYPPTVSLNDFLEERPDSGEILDRLGQLLGYSAGTTAQATAAAIYAYRARVEIDGLIRDVTASAASSTQSGVVKLTVGQIKARPTLVMNRESMNLCERKLALKCMYEADMRTSAEDSTDESGALFRHYKAAAEEAWKRVRFEFDLDEDLIVDSLVTDAARFKVRQRARW